MRTNSDMYFTAYKESDNGYVRCEDIGLPKKTWATKEKRTESGCGVVHAYIWTEDKIRDIGPTDLKVNLGGGRRVTQIASGSLSCVGLL